MYTIHRSTADDYSPHDLLPSPEPRTVSPPFGEFYDNVAKHLVKDTVRIMQNGLPIDLNKVRELEGVLDDVLARVASQLEANPIVRQYQVYRHERLTEEYRQERLSMCRSTDYYIKPFDGKKPEHRSYFMLLFASKHGITPPTELLPTGVPKWSAKQVKQLASSRVILQRLLDGKLTEANSDMASQAMQTLAEDKAAIYNRKFQYQADTLTELDLPPFNPASPDQKHDVFTGMLGLESDKLTDAYKDYEKKLRNSRKYGTPPPEPPKNQYSWDRDNVEMVLNTTSNDDVKDLCQTLIDHSFGAIVKNNFIKAFYDYSIKHDNGYRLHGDIKLFGAKSFRLTSSNPNMLNLPSTRSIYAKPVKKCFVAEKGFIVLAIDYGALEDRVIASLSRDRNKCAIFLEGLDGHCLNAYGYFKDELTEFMEVTGDTTKDVLEFHRLCESGHKELKAIRQRGKPATFGLSYGAFPPKVAASLKISIPAATAIFNSYHEELYPGITEYREEYVLPTAQEHGKIHLGLGCYVKSDNPDKDIRTLHNATCQFWSILTLLAVNKMHQLIDKHGLQDDVQCISTIYDSIYYLVKDDPTTIKWVNDNLVEIMTKDWMMDQTIRNEACSELGRDWADMIQLDNHASLRTTEMILEIVQHDLTSSTHVENEKYITVYTHKYKDGTKDKNTSQPLDSISQVLQWQQEARDYYKEHE